VRLGVDGPAVQRGAQWNVVKSEMDVPQRQLRLALDFPAGTKFACPRCGQLCAVHDTAEKAWRHLDFRQRRTDLRARVPRVSCAEHGVSQVEVLKFPRFSGQAGRRGSRKDIHHAQDPSDLRQRLPSESRQPPDQQPAPLGGAGRRDPPPTTRERVSAPPARDLIPTPKRLWTLPLKAGTSGPLVRSLPNGHAAACPLPDDRHS
jgi:zinc-finger of transposase IS204/IS1001/IS1096/IS1165